MLQKEQEEKQTAMNKKQAEELIPLYQEAMTIKEYCLTRYKSEHLQRLYKEKYNSIVDKVEEIETWLDSIEDAELRDIMRLRYEMGITQQDIADRKGYERSTVAMKIKRYWKKKERADNEESKPKEETQVK